MKNRSSDYIPTAYEIEAERAAAAERIKNIPDPRHRYMAKYMMLGKQVTEEVMAYNAKEAEDYVRQQCGMVGVIPVGLAVSSLD